MDQMPKPEAVQHPQQIAGPGFLVQGLGLGVQGSGEGLWLRVSALGSSPARCTCQRAIKGPLGAA